MVAAGAEDEEGQRGSRPHGTDRMSRSAPGPGSRWLPYNLPMRVLIAPDSFSGTLTATQAAEAIAAGWRHSAPEDELTLMPLSDGGPGFLDVASAAIGGDVVLATVSDPLGRPVPAAILLVDGDHGRTAYVESAQAAGLHLLDANERTPALTSTWGVGELVDLAEREGAGRIVIGLGGSATNDAGAGLLSVLGAGPAQALARGGAALAEVTVTDLGGLREVRHRFRGVEVVIASDIENPLLGFKGASAVFSPQKGATPEVAQQLEAALGHFAETVARALGSSVAPHEPFGLDLLTGKPRRPEKDPGAGAGGGLGYALMLLGGHRVSGVEEVLDAVGFEEAARTHDLVITGEGCLDWQSLSGTVVSGVAGSALAAATPTVVIAGQVMVGRRETMGLGVSGCYAVAETLPEVEAAMADPVGTLQARAARVATTWSPRRGPGGP